MTRARLTTRRGHQLMQDATLGGAVVRIAMRAQHGQLLRIVAPCPVDGLLWRARAALVKGFTMNNTTSRYRSLSRENP